MTWPLEHAYEDYPRIEEEFPAVLDESLHPRGPDLLFGLVGPMGLPPGAVALDVGCGEGRQVLTLHRPFGFRVTGIDPTAASTYYQLTGPVCRVTWWLKMSGPPQPMRPTSRRPGTG